MNANPRDEQADPGASNGDPNDNNPESDANSNDGVLFPATKPGQIERLGNGPDPSSPSWRDEVADFWQGYERPLRTYVVKRMRARGVPGHQITKAKDWVRDFLAKHIASPTLFQSWEEGEGRFRTWIKNPCWWHVENCLRRESPGKQRVTRDERKADAKADGGQERKVRWRRVESLNRDGAPEVTDVAPGSSDVADELDWASQRTWLFLLWIDAFELWNTQHGDWKRWRLFSKLMLIPYAQAQIAGQRAVAGQAEQGGGANPADESDQAVEPKQEARQGKIQINQIYAECGYDTASQAYYAFEKFKKDFDGCVREVLRRQYAGRGATARPHSATDDDTKLAERIDGAYRRYRQLMAREIDWSHQCPGTGEPDQRDALDQFLQRLAGPAHMPLSGDSDLDEAGKLAALADDPDDPPDLAACTLGLIAAVLTQTTYEPTREELEKALNKYLLRPWTSVVTEHLEAAGVAQTVRDVICAALPCSKHWRAIKNAADAARQAADGEIWTDALGAVYYACLAAEVAAGGRAAGPEFTSLSAEQQAEGLRWLERRLWVEPELSDLAARALACLNGRGPADG